MIFNNQAQSFSFKVPVSRSRLLIPWDGIGLIYPRLIPWFRFHSDLDNGWFNALHNVPSLDSSISTCSIGIFYTNDLRCTDCQYGSIFGFLFSVLRREVLLGLSFIDVWLFTLVQLVHQFKSKLFYFRFMFLSSFLFGARPIKFGFGTAASTFVLHALLLCTVY